MPEGVGLRSQVGAQESAVWGGRRSVEVSKVKAVHFSYISHTMSFASKPEGTEAS